MFRLLLQKTSSASYSSSNYNFWCKNSSVWTSHIPSKYAPVSYIDFSHSQQFSSPLCLDILETVFRPGLFAPSIPLRLRERQTA